VCYHSPMAVTPLGAPQNLSGIPYVTPGNDNWCPWTGEGEAIRRWREQLRVCEEEASMRSQKPKRGPHVRRRDLF
jgi:hypothetical protein